MNNLDLNNLDLEYIDYIIIGGGVSGLNIGTKLVNKYPTKSCYIFEKSYLIGGRINTIKKNNMVYESGAARFNNHHKNLIQLLKKYDLYKKKIKIPSYWDTIILNKNNKNKNNLPINIHDFINELITLFSDKKYIDYLRNTTLHEICKKHLGNEYAIFLESNYSYYSEIYTLNAYDSLQLLKYDLNENMQFYILNGGLSQLIDKLKTDFTKNKTTKNKTNKNKTNKVLTNHECIDIEYNTNTKLFTLKIKNDSDIKLYTTRNCIFACDGLSIQKMKFLKKFNIDNYINSVSVQPLLRTYIYYDLNNKNTKLWLDNLNKTVTDDKLKFIIPINNKGLVMISYTDGKYAKYWKNQIINNSQLEKINTSLEKLFPDNKIQKKPLFIENYYWDNGACYWKPHTNSNTISKNMLKPTKYNLFFVGDSYSLRQVWIEGALETSNNLFKIL